MNNESFIIKEKNQEHIQEQKIIKPNDNQQIQINKSIKLENNKKKQQINLKQKRLWQNKKKQKKKHLSEITSNISNSENKSLNNKKVFNYFNDKDDSFGDVNSNDHSLYIEHPALNLPPVDIMFLIDASNSVGNRNFEQVKKLFFVYQIKNAFKIKKNLQKFVSDINICPGRSRASIVLFAAEPHLLFDFNRYHSVKSVKGTKTKTTKSYKKFF